MVGYKPYQGFVSIPKQLTRKIAKQVFARKGEMTKRTCKLANCRLAQSEVYLDAVGYNTQRWLYQFRSNSRKRTKYFFVKRRDNEAHLQVGKLATCPKRSLSRRGRIQHTSQKDKDF